MKNECLLGLVGKACSGKDTVAGYLVERYGFRHVSTSDLIRFYVAEHNLGEPTRDLLRTVGNQLRQEHGADYLVRLAIQSASPFSVISGIRAVAEAGALLEHGTLVLVEAPIELRYKRTVQRGRESDHISLETFVTQERAEDQNPDLRAQNILLCMEMAGKKVTNTGDLQSLQEQLDIFIKSLLY